MNDIKILASQLIEMGVPFYFENNIIIVRGKFSTEWFAQSYDGKLFVYGDFCYSESEEEEVAVDELINRLRLYYKQGVEKMKTVCYYVNVYNENYKTFTSLLFEMMTLVGCAISAKDVEMGWVELTITCEDNPENFVIIQTMLAPYL